MSTFTYTALGGDGRKTAGTLTADSRAAAISQVSALGLHPVRVEESRGPAERSAAISSFSSLRRASADLEAKPSRPGRVPKKAVEAFTRELSNLLAGGVSLSKSLALLRREASNAAAKQLWGSIHDDVMGGTALADALAKWPRNFSSVYIAMVRAGEAGGFLEVVLSQISEFRTREQDLKGKVKAAMIYPAILACLAVFVLIFLLTYFIPQFSQIFTQFGGNLPALTVAIIAASNFMKHYGFFVAAAVFVLVVALRRTLKSPDGKRRFEVIVLGVPVLGRVIAHFALVRFTRMLGTLVASGVPLIASLKVSREAIGNQTLADTVLRGIEEVQRGSSLSKSLALSPTLFPPSVVEMIAVAEETARLDKELIRIANTYEADLDRQLRMLVAIAEPAMLFLMAGIIGTVVIGMLLPVFNMGDLIR